MPDTITTPKEIASTFNFSDFTREEYRKYLQAAKKNYQFRGYTDFDKDERFVLWRHDLDFSIHAARKLAIIEKEEGVKATYFVLPHSEFYNLFEKEIYSQIKQIIALGHDIGLHFDSHFYGIENEDQLETYLLREKKWLEEAFETEIKVFSFHNTSPFTMSCKKWEYAGLINTYAAFFQHEVGYCSDSNGYWRYRRLADVLEKAEDERLQILTHPEWWQEEVMSPWQRISRCIDMRAVRNKEYYVNLLERLQMKNIGWENQMVF